MVEHSLRRVGFETDSAEVALVETEIPTAQPFGAVLAQNAWTMLARAAFRELARPYPTPHRIRHELRRVLASTNMRRTGTRIVLTESMAALSRTRGYRVDVVPVTVPLDLYEGIRTEPQRFKLADPFVLLPGTVTWYKGVDRLPELCALLSERGLAIPTLVLAGSDDGSGCMQRMREQLRGVRLVAGNVSRPEMYWLLSHARCTILLSRLESLSFSLVEALILSAAVVASPLDVHREMALRLGRQPTWWGADDEVACAVANSAASDDHSASYAYDDAAREWSSLGEALGLPGA